MSSDILNTCDTLRILHLPPHLSDDRRTELLQRYGAIKTCTLRPSNKYTITFAKFPSHEAAKEVFLRLHQLNINGKYLSVEFAKKSHCVDISESEKHQNPINDEARKETTNKSHFQAFLHKLNSWSMNQVFTQPPPPNLRYKYAPPTKSILLRIAIQLLKEPAFYTQVLHLMNRMNLPPPFEELESEFPMLKEVYDIEKYKHIFGVTETKYEDDKIQEEEEQDEESEIDSDEEELTRPKEIIPVKRKQSQPKKRLKIPKFVNPAKQPVASNSAQKVVKPEDMFESVQRGEAKNLKINLKPVNKLVLDTADTTVECENNDAMQLEGGFGLMFPNKSAETAMQAEEQESKQNSDYITSEELTANRISTNDQRVLSVFKNYHPGKPSNRLYIKNLAKQVEEKDLHFIYRKFVIPDMKNAEHEYDLRLMQEGRMKGQAFVTLQSINQAQLALDETNGYILKDKPMVVQFAKSGKT